MDQALSPEEISDRTGRRQVEGLVAILEPSFELSGSPGGMAFARCEEDLSDLRGCLPRHPTRSPGMLLETFEAALLKSLGPFVAGLPTNAELSAQSR
jgi:hypothetical protein